MKKRRNYIITQKRCAQKEWQKGRFSGLGLLIEKEAFRRDFVSATGNFLERDFSIIMNVFHSIISERIK